MKPDMEVEPSAGTEDAGTELFTETYSSVEDCIMSREDCPPVSEMDHFIAR